MEDDSETYPQPSGSYEIDPTRRIAPSHVDRIHVWGMGEGIHIEFFVNSDFNEAIDEESKAYVYTPVVKEVARVRMSPDTTQTLIDLLQERLRQYREIGARVAVAENLETMYASETELPEA